MRRKKSRQSIVFFLHPENDWYGFPSKLIKNETKNLFFFFFCSIVEPIMYLENGEAKYKAISALDHLNKRFAETYKY